MITRAGALTYPLAEGLTFPLTHGIASRPGLLPALIATLLRDYRSGPTETQTAPVVRASGAYHRNASGDYKPVPVDQPVFNGIDSVSDPFSYVPGSGGSLEIMPSAVTHPLIPMSASVVNATPVAMSNHDFSQWSDDNPVGWVVANENASNFVTEHPDGLRMVSNNTLGVNISQELAGALTTGVKYAIRVRKSNHVAGAIRVLVTGAIFNGSATNLPGSAANGTFEADLGVASYGTCEITIFRDNTGSTDYVIENIEIIPVGAQATLTAGIWTLRSSGDAVLSVTAGTAVLTGAGQATASDPLQFSVGTGGTVVVRVESGTPEYTSTGLPVFWLVQGTESVVGKLPYLEPGTTRAADTLALPLGDFPQAAGTALIEFAEPITLPNSSSAQLDLLDVNDTTGDASLLYLPTASSTLTAGGTADIAGLTVDALAAVWSDATGEDTPWYRTATDWIEGTPGAYSGTHDIDSTLRLVRTTGTGAAPYQIARTGIYEGAANRAWLMLHYPPGGA